MTFGTPSSSLTLDPSTGPPRLDLPPSQTSIGPRLEPVWTVGSANNATALSTSYIKTYVNFPDPPAVTPQAWGVTWEGNLLASPRPSGQVPSDGSSPARRSGPRRMRLWRG